MLKLYGTKGVHVINPRPEFFETTKVKSNKGTRFISPSQKAEELGNDIYGRSFRGHILECDGKIISNTVENRSLNDSRPASRTIKHAPDLSAALRFSR